MWGCVFPDCMAASNWAFDFGAVTAQFSQMNWYPFFKRGDPAQVGWQVPLHSTHTSMGPVGPRSQHRGCGLGGGSARLGCCSGLERAGWGGAGGKSTGVAGSEGAGGISAGAGTVGMSAGRAWLACARFITLRTRTGSEKGFSNKECRLVTKEAIPVRVPSQ